MEKYAVLKNDRSLAHIVKEPHLVNGTFTIHCACIPFIVGCVDDMCNTLPEDVELCSVCVKKEERYG